MCEITKIESLVKSKGSSGTVNISFKELEPFISDDINFPDKKQRFRMQLKPKLAEKGLDFIFTGDTVRFIFNDSEIPKQVKEIKKTEKVEIVKDEKDYLSYACSDPGSGSDFGHEYIFPEEFKYVKTAVETDGCFPLLVGEKSSGKSRMAEEIAKRLNRHSKDGNVIGKGVPCFRINLEEIEESADLVGYSQLISDPSTQTSKTIFVPGILLEAWIKGYILIMDEIDRSSKAARKQLNMVTEQGGKLMVPSHEGFRFFERHPDCRFIFTANTWGHGDFTGMYDGAEPLNSAWLSRIGPKFEIKTDWSVYKEVLSYYELPKPVIDFLFEKGGGAVQKMNDTININKLQESITLRSFIRFAKVYKVFGWHFGLETCVINEFAEHNRQKMRDVIATVCGLNFKPTSDFEIINSEISQTAQNQLK
ncbi:AAA family ATPase [Candidatus Gracilibacteria bacterium]|nr:AAA family ATPase [Candidatus Gracilibacteria bacterium]